MAGEVRIFGGTVCAEVRSAALVSRERALGDEPREEMRRPAKVLEPSAVANEPSVLPKGPAKGGGHMLE